MHLFTRKAALPLCSLLFLIGFRCGTGVAAEPARYVARDGALHIIQDGQDTELFICAVNFAVAVPGTQAGELAATREQYDRWLARIRGSGFSAIRTYTLHYPRFYDALRDYNLAHPDAPLYLLNGIWLDEDNPSLDLHNLTAAFDQNIVEAVGASYGGITIDPRFGRAFGTYTADVSPWLLAWVIGREIFPDEIETTNTRHSEETAYTGTYLSLPAGTPTEVWATERLDYLATYEHEQYGSARPLSVSSWPTLDPLHHPTESMWSFEDVYTIDLANLDLSRFPSGYFASFHAYPYYPDFMSEDPAYTSEVDEYGPNSYLGYLKALRAHYYPMPVFIAEFGVPSSWGDAHVAHSGMNHGGHDEVAQGHYTVRMFKNMAEAHCAGGAVFAWIDEWWKNTWICEFLDFPKLRRPLWLNVTAAEQNFGLIAFDGPPPVFAPVAVTGESGPISQVSWAATERFFHLEIATDTNQWPLVIGFDTYGDDVGETVLPDGTTTPVRNELALVLDANGAQLFVTEAYDLFGIWHDRWDYIKNTNQLYHSIATDGAPWAPVRWLSNRRHGSDDGTYNFPETIDEIGRLHVSRTGGFVTSRDAVAVGDSLVKLRIPWTLLQFTDPSQAVVMDDNRLTKSKHETADSDGIRLVVAQGGGMLTSDRLLWDKWDAAPPVTEREKASLAIIEAYLIGDVRIEIQIIRQTANSLTFDWTGGGYLQEAPTPAGPWTEAGQAAPATIALFNSPQKFFRVMR